MNGKGNSVVLSFAAQSHLLNLAKLPEIAYIVRAAVSEPQALERTVHEVQRNYTSPLTPVLQYTAHYFLPLSLNTHPGPKQPG